MGQTAKTFNIRPVAKADLNQLNAAFGSEYGRTHADDLADQQAGSRSFFVAWIDDQPVAHAFVHWAGQRMPEPNAAYPGVPEIMRLAVLEPYRQQGIAAALIQQCELEALRRGVQRIGLGTDPAISPANNLYHRLGYEDPGLSLFDDVYKQQRGNEVVTISEPTRLLLKVLT